MASNRILSAWESTQSRNGSQKLTTWTSGIISQARFSASPPRLRTSPLISKHQWRYLISNDFEQWDCYWTLTRIIHWSNWLIFPTGLKHQTSNRAGLNHIHRTDFKSPITCWLLSGFHLLIVPRFGCQFSPNSRIPTMFLSERALLQGSSCASYQAF